MDSPDKGINHCKWLIVEGKDEVTLFNKLFEIQNIEGVFVKDATGKENIKQAIEIAKNNQTPLTHLAVIRDADKNANSTYESVSNALKQEGFPVPKAGEWVKKNDISVGIFIMPDNLQAGMLEDLVIKAYPEIATCADGFFSCVYPDEKFSSSYNLSKSKFKIILATISDKSNGLGGAITNNIINFKDSCFDNIKEFLNSFE